MSLRHLLILQPPPAPVSVAMAPAFRLPVAMGPRAITQPGTVVPPIRAWLFGRGDLANPIAELDMTFARQWQDQLNENGTGEFDISLDDPDVAAITDDMVVRFDLYDFAAFTWLPRDRESRLIAEAEEHDQTAHISGPGHIAVFEEALVYPARGVDALPVQEDRNFDWTVVDFDDAAWINATVLATVYEAQNGPRQWPYTPFGQNFPEPDAPVIGPHMATNEAAPGGPCYLRGTITCEGGLHALYALIDNYGEVYIDGQQIIVVSAVDGFINASYLSIELSPGPHVFAVRCVNFDDPEDVHNFPGYRKGQGPMATALSLWKADANGQPVSLVGHADDTWRIVEFPPSPPGMTAGEVIRHVVQEAQVRGAIPFIELGFNDDTDSSGQPWPIVTTISTKVSTDLLTFFREMAATYIDFALDRASWTLRAWVHGTKGDVSNVEAHAVTDPLDPWSGNIVNETVTVKT